MPNYVPTWDDLQKKSFQADCDEVDRAFLVQAFPCRQCGRKLRKVSIGYICDRCRLVLGETKITQGETNGKEADQEDANGQDAEGQGGRVLDG